MRKRLGGAACLTTTQPLPKTSRRKFVRVEQSPPLCRRRAASRSPLSGSCRLSAGYLLRCCSSCLEWHIQLAAYDATCVGFGRSERWRKKRETRERERERERERALNKRIMSRAARYLAKKVFLHSGRGMGGGLFRPTPVSLRYRVFPSASVRFPTRPRPFSCRLTHSPPFALEITLTRHYCERD